MKSRNVVGERGLVGGEQRARGGGAEVGYVAFHGAGEPARGDFRCAECGYGVCVSRVLPACPMCAGVSWEPGWAGMALPPGPAAPEPWLPAD